MKINIEFLQTGGVPLTNDLMETLQSAYQIYNVLGDLAGNFTILSGCDITGATISPGIVVINGDVLPFEGGLITSDVFIEETEILKTFQDQTDKILIRKKLVKFGNSLISYPWANFVKLDTIKQIMEKANATQAQVAIMQTDIDLLKLKTAPIINGGVVWAWNKPIADIPPGWKECTNLKGKTIVGFDENLVEFNLMGKTGGAKSITQTIDQMPNHYHVMPYQITIASTGKSNSDAFHRVDGSYTSRNTTSVGNGAPMNIMNPYRVCAFIEPNFQ